MKNLRIPKASIFGQVNSKATTASSSGNHWFVLEFNQKFISVHSIRRPKLPSRLRPPSVQRSRQITIDNKHSLLACYGILCRARYVFFAFVMGGKYYIEIAMSKVQLEWWAVRVTTSSKSKQKSMSRNDRRQQPVWQRHRRVKVDGKPTRLEKVCAQAQRTNQNLCNILHNLSFNHVTHQWM